MSKKPLTPVSSLLGLQVRVYKNLHNGLFSIQHKGRVIAHVEHITLVGVTFTVQPAGRAKVLATKCKQVHAFVNGTVSYGGCGSYAERVSYNPYRAATFTDVTGQPVMAANVAEISLTGLYFEQ